MAYAAVKGTRSQSPVWARTAAWGPRRVDVPQAMQDYTPLTPGDDESLGRLIVRCVRGTRLPGGGRSLPFTSSSKAYVELFLKDEVSRLKTPSKRTGLIPKKRNPIWNQEFTFAVKRATEALTLHLEVWDHDAEREDYRRRLRRVTAAPCRVVLPMSPNRLGRTNLGPSRKRLYDAVARRSRNIA